MYGRMLAAIAALFVAAGSHAATLLDETATIVSPTSPSVVVREFDVTTAGAHELTLTDFAVPAALANVRAAVLHDGAIVTRLELGAATSASTSFDAQVGHYSVSIVATPAAAGIGTLGASVRHGTDPPLLEVSDTISTPNPPLPPNRATLDTTFTISAAGDYRVALGDLGFPGALSAIQLVVVRQGGSALDAQLAGPGTATFTATPGDYRLFVVADADAILAGGVYFVAVRAVADDSPVYRRMVLVGRVEQLGSGALEAGSHQLVGSDLELPTALASLRLAVTSEGALVTRLDAAGSMDFVASAATHEVLSASLPATGNAGSYAAELKHGGSSVMSFVNTVSDGSAGAVTLSGNVAAAGSYRLRLTDFVFPEAFSSLRATVTQAGAVVGSLAAPGSANFDLAAGAVKVLVFGQAGNSTNGIFGVDLRPANGTGSAVIETTQGVGKAFAARQFTVAANGRYQVFADDLEFPERFAGLDAVITRGPDVVGSFFGGGSFIFDATPGNYFINFIATPGTTSGGAGTYRMRVADAPPMPTVTLTADSTRVNAGQTTRLNWSTTNAADCVASGAWSGARAASGSETTAALNSQSTFSISCTGPGGSAQAQVVVAVSSQQPNSGGGGGGALSETLLLVLAAAAARRARRNFLLSAQAR